MQPLTFQTAQQPRPQPVGIDVVSKLRHFAIITYAVEPARLAGLFPPRFALDTITVDGQTKGLLSVVPFIDVDFTAAVYSFPTFTMGQTNYRLYVTDTATGEHCVWFLGTVLDSWTVAVPRYLWRLPWHPGRIRFDCDVDEANGRYRQYTMHTEAAWAPARVRLSQEPQPELALPGFRDTETGLVLLTHPLAGYYYRRDGRLGSYRVWHERLRVTPARLASAQFGLLARMGLVTAAEQAQPHSVLVQPETEFTVYLPPRVVADSQ